MIQVIDLTEGEKDPEIPMSIDEEQPVIQQPNIPDVTMEQLNPINHPTTPLTTPTTSDQIWSIRDLEQWADSQHITETIWEAEGLSPQTVENMMNPPSNSTHTIEEPTYATFVPLPSPTLTSFLEDDYREWRRQREEERNLRITHQAHLTAWKNHWGTANYYDRTIQLISENILIKQFQFI